MTGILLERAWPIHAAYVLDEHVWCQVVRPGHDDMPIVRGPNLRASSAKISAAARAPSRP
jgi:hypothetical protein